MFLGTSKVIYIFAWSIKLLILFMKIKKITENCFNLIGGMEDGGGGMGERGSGDL